jgi:hypothetical protein
MDLLPNKVVLHARELLDEVGVGRERCEMFNMSAGEGIKFAAARISKLGPSPLTLAEGKPGDALAEIEQTVESHYTGRRLWHPGS